MADRFPHHLWTPATHPTFGPHHLLTPYRRNATHPIPEVPVYGIAALNPLLKQPQLEGLIASLARSFRALTKLDAIPDCRKAKAKRNPQVSASRLPATNTGRPRPKRRSLAEAVSQSRVSKRVITLVALKATRRPIWARCLVVIALPFSLSWTRLNSNPLVLSGRKKAN